MAHSIDDGGIVAARHPDTQSAHVAHRLTAERQRVDLLVTDGRLDALDRLGGQVFVAVARTFGGWPAAIAFLDGVAAARDFIHRFHDTGVPSIWPAGVIVGVTVFALDLDDPETVAKTADQPRGRWLLATAGDALVDPRARPVAHGAGRAARRRREPS